MGEIATVRAGCISVSPISLDPKRGRPPIDISLEQVELMREARFLWQEISEALCSENIVIVAIKS